MMVSLIITIIKLFHDSLFLCSIGLDRRHTDLADNYVSYVIISVVCSHIEILFT